MSVSKFAFASAVFAATVIGATIPMTASAASTIKSASDCEFEGGSMTNVKGSDYCLVQMRPEEYAGSEYDGNQLGVVDCPGSKLNNDLFCLYPVTVNKTSANKSGMSVVAPKQEPKSADMFLKLEGIDGESVDSSEVEADAVHEMKEIVKETPKKLTSKERRAARKAARAVKKAAKEVAK